jgi:hypothetical protein
MNNVIMENTEEEDETTPDSALKAYQERKSFKTNAFNSVDSFVQLENQLLNRGDSLLNDANHALKKDLPLPFPLQE